MLVLKMVFSRSYTLLRLACQKAGGATNFIFKNSSKNTKHFALFSSDGPKDETPIEGFKDYSLPLHATRKNAGYIDRLENNTSTHSIINNEDNNSNNKQLSNESNESSNVSIFENGTYKFADISKELNDELPRPLNPCDEDLSHIGPYAMPTYNFAKYADDSYTLQQLVKLGVKLYKLEKERDLVEMYLKLDFNKDIKPYIQFLYDCGVHPESIGDFITKFPRIFKEDMDDLHTRIRYLRAHKFIPEMIQAIVNRNPLWLSFKTQDIDYRLGYFQNTFYLSGYQTRCLAVKSPKVITYDMEHLKENTFAVKEEMGFNRDEMRQVVLKAPRIWIHARHKVLNSFDYVHNQMKLSHEIISKEPQILLCRKNRLQQRHEFLVHLKRNQYDPLKPLYISPMSLVTGSDIEFCKTVAKASIDTYNMFLKTM